jgi:hypothetical protein
MSVKITYQNVRTPGEVGVRIVPDDREAEDEKKHLEARGFVVIEIMKMPSLWPGVPRA